MDIIAVWVLALITYGHGSVVIYDNLADYDSCYRLQSRIQDLSPFVASDYRHLAATCTEVHKLVPKAPVITVQPPAVTVPVTIELPKHKK